MPIEDTPEAVENTEGPMSYFIPLLLPLFALLCNTSVFADSVSDLKQYLSTTSLLQGHFSQTVTTRSGKKQVSSGNFSIQRPGKFRWHYQKPYEQLIVGDGRRVWLYDPDLAQVTVKEVSKALDASPAALLAGENNLEVRYTLKSLPNSHGMTWVEAKPKQEDSNFNLIQLGMTTQGIKRMKLKDGFDQTTEIDFNITHGKVNPTQFTFTPPKHVDILYQ